LDGNHYRELLKSENLKGTSIGFFPDLESVLGLRESEKISKMTPPNTPNNSLQHLLTKARIQGPFFLSKKEKLGESALKCYPRKLAENNYHLITPWGTF